MQRPLDAAAHEFASHGFAATRIRDIVPAAGVNRSSMNDRFGGKEGLCRATLAMLPRQANDERPRESSPVRALAPEEQRHAFVRVMRVRYFGGEQASRESRVVAREPRDPWVRDVTFVTTRDFATPAAGRRGNSGTP